MRRYLGKRLKSEIQNYFSVLEAHKCVDTWINKS